MVDAWPFDARCTIYIMFRIFVLILFSLSMANQKLNRSAGIGLCFPGLKEYMQLVDPQIVVTWDIGEHGATQSQLQGSGRSFTFGMALEVMPFPRELLFYIKESEAIPRQMPLRYFIGCPPQNVPTFPRCIV